VSEATELPTQQGRGGPVWGSRLRRSVQAPDYYKPETG
jgi:hypothetical protein